jgi:hypothetical protein
LLDEKIVPAVSIKIVLTDPRDVAFIPLILDDMAVQVTVLE